MKKIISILGVFIFVLFMSFNFVINDGIRSNSCKLTTLQKIAMALEPTPETSGETAQKGKFTRARCESHTEYGKFNASGQWVVYKASVEGGYSRTVTDKWNCCSSGGNGCSSNNPAC